MYDDRAVGALASEIEAALRKPVFFSEILIAFRGRPYRTILRAWSDVRSRRPLARDVHGRYWLEGGSEAAKAE
jgi:hypothetical protein